MDHQSVETAILEFVQRRFHSPRRKIEPSTHLFREGIVDSLGVLELVRFLEDQFGLQIGPDDLKLENFQSIAAMRNFIQDTR